MGTNAAILCFTMNVLHTTGPTSVWLFISFQYFVFLIMFVSEKVIDDEPMEVWGIFISFITKIFMRSITYIEYTYVSIFAIMHEKHIQIHIYTVSSMYITYSATGTYLISYLCISSIILDILTIMIKAL